MDVLKKAGLIDGPLGEDEDEGGWGGMEVTSRRRVRAKRLVICVSVGQRNSRKEQARSLAMVSIRFAALKKKASETEIRV